MSASLTTRYSLAALILGVACVAAPIAAAQNAADLRGKPSKDEILRALAPSGGAPAPRTRGLSLGTTEPSASAAAPAAATAAAPAAAAKAAPQEKAIDLDIPFEFNSDRLTDDGREVLDQLGAALNSAEMASVKQVVLEGHTDAKGSAAYNKMLSLRRAQSVRTYLAQNQKVSNSKLKAVGKGSTELADPNKPEDAVNRRVRVVVDY
jgi:outer membrane protein OmpA-like peptidoglycan-associated protein